MSIYKNIIHEPENEYHARSKSGECMSSHLMQLFCKSPYKYFQEVFGEKKEEGDNPAFAFGRAAHKYILEGIDAFNECYVVSDGPINEKTGLVYGRTTKAYQDWLASQIGEVVTTEDYETITAMKEACHNVKTAHEMLSSSGEPECVVRHEIDGVPCQIRIDWLSDEHGIIDLKTCRDIEFFEKDCRDFGYAYQMAFYRMVFRESCGVELPCRCVAVDKTKYHIAGIWQFASADLDECERVLRAALKRYKNCRETGVWPTGFDNTRVFALHKEY